MGIPVDRDGPEPLYRQIEGFLREQIESGALSAGIRVRAIRDLADGIGVSKIVMASVY